jgi:hypothetical protein
MTNFLEKELRLQDQRDEENRELWAERNRGIVETADWIENIKKRNRLNRKGSVRSLAVRCITHYALDGAYHPNLRNIELLILNKDGSIQYNYTMSFLFFDEVVLKDWINTARYGNVSWYKEEEVSND